MRKGSHKPSADRAGDPLKPRTVTDTNNRPEDSQDTGQRKRARKDRSVPPPDTLVLTVPQVADRLQISPRKVWDLIAYDKLPAMKFGNCTRVSLADLAAYMSKSKQGAH